MKHKIHNLKPIATGIKVARWLLFLLIVINSNKALAQNLSDYTLTWNANVGCQIFSSPKPNEDPGLFINDIEASDCVRVCEDSNIVYKLTGDLSGNPNVQWTVSGGTYGTIVNTPTTSSITLSWGTAGGGSLSFSINTPSGGTITKTLCIEIIKKPQANFLTNPIGDNSQTEPIIYACVGQPIQFTDASTANGGSPIVDYYWTFGDNIFSAEKDPTHTYSNPGMYIVNLTITNSCGCQSVVKKTVKITPARGFEISCASAVCEGNTSTYSLPFNGEQVCNEFNFSVQGGDMVNPNDGTVSVTWNNVDASGFGLVSFNPGNKCQLECLVPTSIRIPVIQSNGTITGNGSICFGQQERYQLPQWPATDFQWSIQGNSAANPLGLLIHTDQPNEIIIKPYSLGPIVLICNYQNTFLHCGGAATYTINVNSPEIINGPTNLCVGSSANYSTLSNSNVDWSLTLNNSVVSGGTANQNYSFNYNFTLAGNYVLTVSSPYICNNQLINITVKPVPPPVKLATIVQPSGLICPSVPYTYSVSPANPNMDYTWSITGGVIIGSANDNEVLVKFNQSGPYLLQVTQQIKDQPSCVSTMLDIPVNVFTIDAGITDNGTTYVLSSNNLSSCANTEKTYYAINSTGTAGLYTIGDTYTWIIIPSTAGSIITGQGTNKVNVLWNNVNTPSIAQLVLQINKCTRNSTLTKNVDVIPQRSLTLTANNGCSGGLITMDLSSNMVIPVGTQINWNFGNGNTYSQTVVVAATSVTNSYTYYTNPSGNVNFLITASIVLPASGICAGESTKTTTVNITPGPIADLSMTGTGNVFCNLAAINTVLTAANAGSGVVKWFRFPNNYLVTTSTFNVSTYGPGTYYYTISSGGCTSRSENATISVIPCGPPNPCTVTPTPNLTLSSSGNCGPLTLHATATPPPAAGYSSSWSIVGPDPAANINDYQGIGGEFYDYSTPIAAAGVYHVNYKAIYICTNGQAAESNTSLDVTIPYLASFTTKVNCGLSPGSNYSVTLTSTSSFMSSIPLANRTFLYYWSHSLSGPWIAINASSAPTTTFNQPTGDLNGDYYFKLIIGENTNTYAHCEKIIDHIDLAPDPVRIVNVRNPSCYNDAVRFGFDNTNPNDISYLWTFDTLGGLPLATNTLETPSRVFDELASGLAHNVKVTVDITNRYGCVRRLTKEVTIPARCYYGDITTATPSICKGGSLVLNYTVGSHADNCAVSQYQWMEGSNQIGTSTTPTYTLTNVTGSKFYWVRLVNASGCTYNCTSRIVPNYLPMPSLKVSAPSIVCGSGGTATATVGANTAVAWYVDSVLQPNTSTNLVLSNFSIGTHTLSVVATLNGSCSKTITQVFTVKAPPATPTVSFNIDCASYKVTLLATPPAGGTGTLTWSSGTVGNPTIVNQGGPYSVTYNDGSGCLSSEQLDVPYSLDKYLWIFPSGCYTQCDNNVGTLTGANLYVPKWFWMYEDSVESIGNGVVQPYQPTQSGAYTLTLNNGICAQESAPMNLKLIRCSECKFERVETDIKCAYGELFRYTMTLSIENGGGLLNTSISVPGNQVILSPASFPLANGISVQSFNVIPINGFTTGTLHFILTSTDEQGEICTYEFDATFQDCGKAKIGSKEVIKKANPSNFLLYPTPANGEVTAQFELSSENAEILIYDLSGKQLARYAALNKKGSINLNIASLASGIYVVVLKENGQTTLQKKLVVN